MNRKHIIEKLKAFKLNNAKTPLEEALQYAIDHLSRECVSRKTHRTKVEALYERVRYWEKQDAEREAIIDQLKAKQIDPLENYYNVTELRAQKKIIVQLKDEIGQLKADKDRLRSAFDKSLEKIRQLNKECSTKELARFEALREAQRSKRHRIWLSISTIALLITLLISLFNR